MEQEDLRSSQKMIQEDLRSSRKAKQDELRSFDKIKQEELRSSKKISQDDSISSNKNKQDQPSKLEQLLSASKMEEEADKKRKMTDMKNKQYQETMTKYRTRFDEITADDMKIITDFASGYDSSNQSSNNGYVEEGDTDYNEEENNDDDIDMNGMIEKDSMVRRHILYLCVCISVYTYMCIRIFIYLCIYVYTFMFIHT
jgi:hypothetical protein